MLAFEQCSLSHTEIPLVNWAPSSTSSTQMSWQYIMLSIYVGIESTGMMIHTSLHINAIPTKFHPFEPPFNFM